MNLLAIDANSLAHRAFHSTRADDAAGEHAVTGAVASMLAVTWRHGPYDALIAAFDHPVNRRRRDWPEYKANRPSTDPAITAAVDRLRDDLSACGLTVARHEGAEADDLLATVADACTARGWRCDLLSSDRDLVALVGNDVRLLRPGSTFADLHVEDLDEVVRRYGVRPQQYPDLAALRGDPSDGLDGVPGVGTKTAARLLRDHGSVGGIYEAISDLPPRVEAALRAARATVERNLLLMAPLPHLSVDVDAAVRSGVDPGRIHDVLTARGVETAARRLRNAILQPAPPVAPPPLTPPDVADEPRPPRERQHPEHPHVGDVHASGDGEQTSLF